MAKDSGGRMAALASVTLGDVAGCVVGKIADAQAQGTPITLPMIVSALVSCVLELSGGTQPAAAPAADRAAAPAAAQAARR